MTKPFDAFKPLMIAVNEALEALKEMRDRLLALFTPRPILHTPDSHSYLPDYDLCCAFKGCGLGPEEHPFTPRAHIHRPSPYYRNLITSFLESFCTVCGEILYRVSEADIREGKASFVLVTS